MSQKAILILSGGQDSATCAYWARYNNFEIHAVTFDYGQRHKIEIESAKKIAGFVGAASHEIIVLGDDILKGTSPLVNPQQNLELYKDHDSLPGGLEKTFVPMRNQLFLTIAANRAYLMDANVLITGVCEEDSGGYPDCRSNFITSFEETASLGTFTGEDDAPGYLSIYTPLMALNKSETVRLALSLPGCYAALAYTHTAYDGQYPPTGHDHASLLRARGFIQAGVPDPLVVRAWQEGLMALPKQENYNIGKVQHVQDQLLLFNLGYES